METGLTEIKSPEEEELAQKLNELRQLESELAQKELDLVTLIAGLQALEAKYLRVVGRRFAELDQINAEIYKQLAMSSPDDMEAQEEARVAKKKAEETARTYEAEEGIARSEKFIPTEELKDLYRRIAKKIHPDLAMDDTDREKRNRIMSEANQAYSEGDVERLNAILREWETSPEAIEGEDVGSRLIRTIRMISRVRRRISAIENELKELMLSELYELKRRVDEAKEEGRDLIMEIASQIDEQIKIANKRLAELR